MSSLEGVALIGAAGVVVTVAGVPSFAGLACVIECGAAGVTFCDVPITAGLAGFMAVMGVAGAVEALLG